MEDAQYVQMGDEAGGGVVERAIVFDGGAEIRTVELGGIDDGLSATRISTHVPFCRWRHAPLPKYGI